MTRNKQGQMTIFIVAAVFVVAAVIFLLIFIRQGKPSITASGDVDPQRFIGSCVHDRLQEVVEAMIPQGGFVNPTDYKIYEDTRVTYLCKNLNDYEPCVSQYPLYLESLKEEIKKNTRNEIDSCFAALKQELDNRNYETTIGQTNTVVTFEKETVVLTMKNKVTLSKNGVIRTFESFSTRLRSPLYELAQVAQLIGAQEAQFCYFEYVGYMVLHPELDIRKYTMSDSTRIYTILNKNVGEAMHIAIRGCSVPAGY